MTNALTIFNQLRPHTIGYDNIFDHFNDMFETSTSLQTNYPPYDIVKHSDTHYDIQVALAGYSKDDIEGNVKLAVKPKTKTPPLYRVLMMNDDYTPMEFVIEVLEKFFQKNREEATQIMLHVHQRGVGVCGIYTYDLAETKAMQVMNYARKYEHPLQVQLEKE